MRTLPLFQLWNDFKVHGSQSARAQIIERHRHLVTITANRIAFAPNSSVERDDLVSVGVIGLIKAVDQFDPSRNILFNTYAITLIKGSMLESLRGGDWVPRLVRDQQKLVSRTSVALEARLGRASTEDELAEEMGVSLPRLNKIMSDISRTNLMRLEDLNQGVSNRGAAECGYSHQEVMPSDDPSPFDLMAIMERSTALGNAIKRLPETERNVVIQYYFEEKTFRQIGGEMDRSESRAYQIHSEAVKRLRSYMELDKSLFEESLFTV